MNPKMKILAKILTGVLLLFFVLTAPCTADIKSFKIRSDDRHLIIIDEFKFTHTGHVSVVISSVSVTSMQVTSNLSRPDPSRIGFYLVSDYALSYMYDENISCVLDSKFISLLFTFQDLSQSSFNKSYDVTSPDLYTLRFANCNPLSRVTMNVRTEFYNTVDNGTTKDYLSAGQTILPSFYFKLYLIYLFCLGFWTILCCKNHQYFNWIHFLMGVLLLMKGVNLLCASKVEHSIKVTGIPPRGWNVMLYIFQFITNVFFYGVIAVIIDVCCYLKTVFLGTIGLIIVIPLQIFATIASKRTREVLYEDSVISGFGILEPLFFFFCNVGDIILIGISFCVNSETRKAAKNYLPKLTLIWVFYIVFIVYSVVAFVCGVMGSDGAKTAEIASLVFYIVMFLVFMPSVKNDYFVSLNYLQAPRSSVELGCGA